MQRGKFLAAHHDAAVAGKQNHLFIRTAQLCTHGGGQTEAHGPQTAAGQEMTGLVHIIELGRPHLMLSYIGHHHGIFVRMLHDRLI